jgi:hypothetical protein
VTTLLACAMAGQLAAGLTVAVPANHAPTANSDIAATPDSDIDASEASDIAAIAETGIGPSSPWLTSLSADAQDQREPPTPPHTGIRALTSGLLEDVRHLPSLPNAYLAMLGGGLAIGAHPLDGSVNARLRGHQSAATPIFAPGKYVGQTPVQVGAALGVYVVGRLDHKPKASHLGMDLLRAQILTSALTTGLKYAAHRERPDHSNPHSFPSGHASITFATATVIERHLGWRSSALGYAVASYVAASRLHDNRHYLSDVIFGAAVGAIGGRTVTEHGRSVWTLAPVSIGDGVAVMLVRN